MELVYDYVSEERKEEVKKMGILTPYGGKNLGILNMWKVRMNIIYLNV